MKRPADWRTLDLSGDPVLVVGRRRPPRGLKGFVVDLHTETFGTMREIAQATTAELAGRTRHKWHPNAIAEPGEQYLSVSVDELPARVGRRRRVATESQHSSPPPSDPRLAQAADLLREVLDPGRLDNIDPDGLGSEHLLFYGLSWQRGDDGKPVAFVSKYDPTTVLRKASHFFRFAGTLRSADAPDFALNDRADLVITTEEVAILSESAFDHLFSDIRGMLNDVPANAASLKVALTHLPMSAESQSALIDICSRKPSLARRLQNFAASASAAAVTPNALTTVLKKHGQAPKDFISNGTLEIGPEQAEIFLDVAEGRWYEADFTAEPRRAARWSRR